MNDIQPEFNEQSREKYSAPTYERFAFESSDLVATSDVEDFGDHWKDKSEDVGWE